MNPFHCPACQHRVADVANVCPQCHAPLPVIGKGRRRPRWVYLVLCVYVALVVTVTLGPHLWVLATGQSLVEVTATLLYAVFFLACGLSLIVVPVGTIQARAPRRRSIWFAIVGSATLATFVFFGFAFASHEFAFGSDQSTASDLALRAILFSLPGVWVLWMIVFGMMASSIDASRLNGLLARTLFAGTVLELLVALPMHLVVRRRSECCAGIATGIGIGIGVLVMVLTLGPAVLFLFYRRYQQVYASHGKSDPRAPGAEDVPQS